MIALGCGGAYSPNQESKLRYISIWEGALPLRGAVAPVINKTPIYSLPSAHNPNHSPPGPQSLGALDAEHKSHNWKRHD